MLTAVLPARAADLALKAPAAAPIPFSWTGCFIGAHAGGAVSDDRTTSALGSSAHFGSTGFVGGGQAGCDYQFAPNWVVGVEGRAAWSSLSNSHNSTVRNLVTGVVRPSVLTTRNDFLASATARLGYSLVPRWLFYVRGGAAWTDEKLDDAFTDVAGVARDPGTSTTRTGWTAGAGAEWAFAPHWSANVEYNFYDFGNSGRTLTQALPPTTVTINSMNDTIHAVTVGVNYRF